MGGRDKPGHDASRLFWAHEIQFPDIVITRSRFSRDPGEPIFC